MMVWQALGFMALGAVIAEVYEFRMWRRYREGKAEAARMYRNDKQGRV